MVLALESMKAYVLPHQGLDRFLFLPFWIGIFCFGLKSLSLPSLPLCPEVSNLGIFDFISPWTTTKASELKYGVVLHDVKNFSCSTRLSPLTRYLCSNEERPEKFRPERDSNRGFAPQSITFMSRHHVCRSMQSIYGSIHKKTTSQLVPKRAQLIKHYSGIADLELKSRSLRPAFFRSLISSLLRVALKNWEAHTLQNIFSFRSSNALFFDKNILYKNIVAEILGNLKKN